MERFNVQIHYLKRARRATIRLMPNSIVRVTVPHGIDEAEVNKLLQTKSKWIFEKHRILESVRSERKIEYVSGEALPFYGKELRLKVIEGYGAAVEKDNYVIVHVPKGEDEREAYVKAAVVKWYKAQAIEKIEDRVAHYCSLLGVLPNSISIKNYKSRWGACSAKGDLIFNWQIITFNKKLFDYVIAHEICHLKEMNHSKRFYQLLNRVGFHKGDIHPQIRYLRNLF